MDDRCLLVHRFLPLSCVNGPGRRAVVWTQGCSLRCPGCFNPETHPFEGGEKIAVDDLIDKIIALDGAVEGITISGGEPLDQVVPVIHLIERVANETGLSVVLFTGYTWEEVSQMPQCSKLFDYVDVLITGRYDEKMRLAAGLCGSSNQEIHLLSNRYSMADIVSVPESEIIIQPDGSITLTGIDPVDWET